MKGILSFRKKSESPSILIKYEDLVRNPEYELRRVCQFLEEDYAPRMLEYHKSFEKNITSVEKANNIHTKLGRLPTEDDIQKWKKTDAALQLFLAESVMHKELVQMGYELSEFNPIRPIHQLKKGLYHFFNLFNMALFFIYHRMLGRGLKQIMSNTILGKVLRKVVRST